MSKEKGILTDQDIKNAWEFFDPKGTGVVSLSDLKKTLSLFYPKVTSKEAKSLTRNMPEITKQDFSNMLKEASLPGFDYIGEAFKLFDTKGEGRVNSEFLKEVLVGMKVTDITDDDLSAVLDSMDSNLDGHIGLEDFKKVVEAQRADVL